MLQLGRNFVGVRAGDGDRQDDLGEARLKPRLGAILR
jgi:hypothetical protein